MTPSNRPSLVIHTNLNSNPFKNYTYSVYTLQIVQQTYCQVRLAICLLAFSKHWTKVKSNCMFRKSLSNQYLYRFKYVLNVESSSEVKCPTTKV